MSLRPCIHCGTQFHADAAWKRTCLRCWKREKGIQDRAVVEAFERGYRAGLKVGQSRRPDGPAADELHKNLRALSQLCHPDKHGGSDASTRITQWLNALAREKR